MSFLSLPAHCPSFLYTIYQSGFLIFLYPSITILKSDCSDHICEMMDLNTA